MAQGFSSPYSKASPTAQIETTKLRHEPEDVQVLKWPGSSIGEIQLNELDAPLKGLSLSATDNSIAVENHLLKVARLGNSADRIAGEPRAVRYLDGLKQWQRGQCLQRSIFQAVTLAKTDIAQIL